MSFINQFLLNNYCSQRLFRYHRCEFSLELSRGGHGVGGGGGGRAQQQVTDTPVHVTPFTKWETIAEKLKPSERPVVLNRASSTNTTNPFGSTFCYGYQDIIFEVSHPSPPINYCS